MIDTTIKKMWCNKCGGYVIYGEEEDKRIVYWCLDCNDYIAPLCCPRCIEDWQDGHALRTGEIEPSACKDCGVCKDCEHLVGCSALKN